MKAETLRVYKVVHTWTGLVAGMALFIAFYAGALSVFGDAIVAWQAPASPNLDSRTLDARSLDAQTLERAPALIEATLAQPGAQRGMMLTLSHRSTAGPITRWTDPQTRERHAGRLDETGTFRIDDEGVSRLAASIDEIHRGAGIPGEPGEIVMGIISVLYGLALISGIVVLIPTLVSDLFALRIGRNLKRLWQDAHNLIGTLSLPFHVVFVITGIIMTLHDPLLAAMNQVIYGNEQGKALLMRTALPAAMPRPSNEKAPLLPPVALMKEVHRIAPGFEPIGFIYNLPGDRNAMVTVMGRAPGALAHTSRIALNAANGEVLAVELPGRRPDGMTALSGFAALHFGDYGGLPVRWLYLLLGLAGAFLFYSGNLLWLESRRRRNADVQPRNQRLLAGATVGVCLGACAGISAMFVSSKLFEGLAIDRPAWELGTYHLVFFACVGWALLRPPIRAGSELLALCALLTCAIPLANWAVTGRHLLHTAGTGDWAVFGIDAAAILAALVFAGLSRQSHRRATRGQATSVWSTATH